MTAVDRPDNGQDEGLRQRLEALADDLDRLFREAGADEPRGSRTRQFASCTGIGYRRAALRLRDVLAGGDGSLYYGALPWLRRPERDDQSAACPVYSHGSDGWHCATTGPHAQHSNADRTETW